MTTTPLSPWSDQTEQAVRTRMLDAVDDSFNRGPGDIIFDMLTPAAMEVAQVYANMTTQVQQCFIPWASGAYLDAMGLILPGALVRLSGEPDDRFRHRLITRLRAPVGAGSELDYITWARASGVNIGVVSASSDGSGAITVRVASSDRDVVSSPDVAAAQAYIEARAPLGATVTVASVISGDLVPVTVTCDVIMRPGYSVADASTEFAVRMNDLINELGFGDDVTEGRIIGHIMDTTGVLDLNADPVVNSGAAPVVIGASELATFSAASLS